MCLRGEDHRTLGASPAPPAPKDGLHAVAGREGAGIVADICAPVSGSVTSPAGHVRRSRRDCPRWWKPKVAATLREVKVGSVIIRDDAELRRLVADGVEQFAGSTSWWPTPGCWVGAALGTHRMGVGDRTQLDGTAQGHRARDDRLQWGVRLWLSARRRG